MKCHCGAFMYDHWDNCQVCELVPNNDLVKSINIACRALQITPNQVREDLSAEDIADILSGYISTEMLRIYAQCLDDSLAIRF